MRESLGAYWFRGVQLYCTAVYKFPKANKMAKMLYSKINKIALMETKLLSKNTKNLSAKFLQTSGKTGI